MRGRLTTPDGKREYAKRITVAEGPFGNMKVNKRWNQLNHRGLKMVKGECLLHAIGHNLGVICKNVSIDRIESLESIQILSNSFENSMVIPYHPPIFGQGCVPEAFFEDRYGELMENWIWIRDPDYGLGLMCS